jgi:arylsulfatase A-like enzyme
MQPTEEPLRVPAVPREPGRQSELTPFTQDSNVENASNTPPDTAEASSTGRCGLGLAETFTLAASVAIVGSLLLGVAEALLVVAKVSSKLGGESVPTDLLVAALARNTLTHALLWCPLMIVVALAYWAAARRRPKATPLPFLTAVFVALAGAIVVPADLILADRTRPTLLIGGGAAAIVLAALVYLALQLLSRKFTPAGPIRLTRGLAYLSMTVAALSAVVFARSPLFNPAAWRASQSSLQAARPAQPHVLWIVLDTARPDHLSCYGYPRPTTPFLEQWAGQALVCDLAIANGMWTVPAHASMFTGLSRRAHGTDHSHLWLDDSLRTVAELLAEAGYATALFSNNPLVASDTNLTKGFQTRRILYHLRRMQHFSLDALCERLGITPFLPWLDQDFGAALTNHYIARWLDEHPDRPKFVFINYMETHLPYRVPLRYRRMFLDGGQVDHSYDLRFRLHGNILPRLDLDYNIESADFLTARDRDVLRGQYDAAIRYLDDRVREATELFRQRGLLENTLVVIASDHGEHLGTHGMWSHRFLAHQDLVRVALLIREPGRREALRISTPVQLSDLFPTVLNATVWEPGADESLGTRDLLASAAQDQTRIAICECEGPASSTRKRFKNRTDPAVLHRATSQIAAVGQRFKLINSADGMRELYDLSVDPGERHNLIDVHPGPAARLDAYLRAWLEFTPEYAPVTKTGESRSPEVLQSLRGLGYVGDE